MIFLRISVMFMLVLPGLLYGQTISHEGRLMNDLFSTYDKRVRPTRAPTIIVVGLSINILTKIDQREQVLSGNFGIVLAWVDERLSWNASEYDELSDIVVDSSTIWTPDIIVRNALGNKKGLGDISDRSVTIYNGNILFFPSKDINVRCSMDASKFPFDEQNCTIILGSSHATSNQLNMIRIPSHVGIDHSSFLENNEWEFTKTSAEIREESIPGAKYPRINFEIHFRRRSFDFVASVLIPIIILTFLNQLCYHLPIESGEKLNICMISFLTFAVFASSIRDSLPRSSINIPRFNVYLMVQFVLSGFNILAQAFVLHIYFSNEPNMSIVRRIVYKLCNLIKQNRRSTINISLNSENELTTSPKATGDTTIDTCAEIRCGNHNDFPTIAIKIDRYLGFFAVVMNIASLATYLGSVLM